MPRAENVIDFRDDNLDGALSIEEQLLDKSDALGIDEDEAEDIADELEDELEEKGEEMLERLEELDDDAVKSLIASIEDKDEQRDVLAYLSQHKNASLFGNLAKNIFKRTPTSLRDLERDDAKKEKKRHVNLENRFRKRFFNQSLTSLIRLYKTQWKDQEKEIKENLADLADILDTLRETLESRKNKKEAKLLLSFKKEEIVPIYSRINILNKNFTYTIAILKKAKSLSHSPNRMLFKDPIVKIASDLEDEKSVMEDLQERFNRTRKNRGISDDGKIIPLTTEAIKNELSGKESQIRKLLKGLREALKAKDIHSEIHRNIAVPINELVKEFENIVGMDQEFEPPLDTTDAYNRFLMLAKEILSIDQAIESLGEKYEKLVDSVGLTEETANEFPADNEEETEEEQPADNSDDEAEEEQTADNEDEVRITETDPYTPPNASDAGTYSSGFLTNETELPDLIEAALLENKDIDWKNNVYEQLKGTPIKFKKRSNLIEILVSALIGEIKKELAENNVNPASVESEILKNEGKSLEEIIEELKPKVDPDSPVDDAVSRKPPTENPNSELKDGPEVGKTPDTEEGPAPSITEYSEEAFRNLIREKEDTWRGLGLDFDYIMKNFTEGEGVDLTKEFERLAKQKKEEEAGNKLDTTEITADTPPTNENLVDEAINKYLETVEDDNLKEKYRSYLDLVRDKLNPKTNSIAKYIETISKLDENPDLYVLTLFSVDTFPEDLPEKMLELSGVYGGLPSKNENALTQIEDYFDDPDNFEPLYLSPQLEETDKENATFCYIPIDRSTGYVFPSNPDAPLKKVIKDSRLNDLFRATYQRLTGEALGNTNTTAKQLMEFKRNNYSLLPRVEFKHLGLKPRSVLPEHTASFRARKIALAYLYVNRSTTLP